MNRVITWIKNEPILTTAIVAALGVFSNLRWNTTRSDLFAQITGGLTPIVLGVIGRLLVTPTSKLKDALGPDNLAALRGELAQLRGQVDLYGSGPVKQLMDALATTWQLPTATVAVAVGQPAPQTGEGEPDGPEGPPGWMTAVASTAAAYQVPWTSAQAPIAPQPIVSIAPAGAQFGEPPPAPTLPGLAEEGDEGSGPVALGGLKW